MLQIVYKNNACLGHHHHLHSRTSSIICYEHYNYIIQLIPMLSLCIVCGRYPKAVIRTLTQYRDRENNNIANPGSLITYNQPPLLPLPPPINVMSVSLSLAGFGGWFPVVGSSLPASHFRLLAADYCTFLRCRQHSLKQTTTQVTDIIYALL